MRLPWIQVDKEGIARCRRLARHLKVPEAQGIGIGMMLWEYALEISPDGDFTGNVPDTDSLAVAVMWPVEDAARLVTEMQRVGMLATHPRLRVRGLDRYRSAWEKNRRKYGKHADSGHAFPGSALVSDGSARKTETETETDKKQLPFPGADAPGSGGRPKPKAKTDKPTDPRHAPLIKALTETFVAIKGVPYPFSGGRDAKAVAGLLAKAEPDVINHAWARALREATHPPIACIHELEPKLAHFIGTGPPKSLNPRAPQPVADWTNAVTGEIPA